jgi:pyruvate ferredoxin oxidoreductase beta subunit
VTTTSPAGQRQRGSIERKKDLFEIVAAHGIAYAATTTVAHTKDLVRKVERARDTQGTSFLHILAPCPTGWGVETNQTLQIARAAVDCGLWVLAEYADGQYHLNATPKKPDTVAQFLRAQGRFAHVRPEDVEALERRRDRRWAWLQKLSGSTT